MPIPDVITNCINISYVGATPLLTSHAFYNASHEMGEVKSKVVKSRLPGPPGSSDLDSCVSIGIMASGRAPFVEVGVTRDWGTGPWWPHGSWLCRGWESASVWAGRAHCSLVPPSNIPIPAPPTPRVSLRGQRSSVITIPVRQSIIPVSVITTSSSSPPSAPASTQSVVPILPIVIDHVTPTVIALHDASYVHGDLRGPNTLPTADGYILTTDLSVFILLFDLNTRLCT